MQCSPAVASWAVVATPTEARGATLGKGSFDCVRRAPHFAQDDRAVGGLLDSQAGALWLM
jgi:hypothetical protein